MVTHDHNMQENINACSAATGSQSVKMKWKKLKKEKQQIQCTNFVV